MEGGRGFNINEDLPPVLGASQGLSGLCNRCRFDMRDTSNVHPPGLHHFVQYLRTMRPQNLPRLPDDPRPLPDDPRPLPDDPRSLLDGQRPRRPEEMARGFYPGQSIGIHLHEWPREADPPRRPGNNNFIDELPEPRNFGTCPHCHQRIERNGRVSIVVSLPFLSRGSYNMIPEVIHLSYELLQASKNLFEFLSSGGILMLITNTRSQLATLLHTPVRSSSMSARADDLRHQTLFRVCVSSNENWFTRRVWVGTGTRMVVAKWKSETVDTVWIYMGCLHFA